ncbi:conserved Plasmodium protein, unknown function [Plasmodium gallinaceum]|uniref:Uncharacterized protein n=1 Tax=Plasmodium gallinaceum TaxID=5849 RepID=A0A1J1GNH1_PLAGA|nr:conserved Plasmodium protein, unknown function [Plasmodium gallinaceum]CRG94002.1 conserved Plasmodium protein, unknown function [Plasmodium gallinaceum]
MEICKEECHLLSIDNILSKYDLYMNNLIKNDGVRDIIEKFIFQYNSFDECEKKLIYIIKNFENFTFRKFQRHYLFITNLIKEICHTEFIAIIYNEILKERNLKESTFYIERNNYEYENKIKSDKQFKNTCEAIYKKYILVIIKILYFSSNLSYNYHKNLINSLSYICILISKYDTFISPNEKFSELIYRIFWQYYSKNFSIINENYFSVDEDESSSSYDEILKNENYPTYITINNLHEKKTQNVEIYKTTEKENFEKKKKKKERKVIEKFNEIKKEKCIKNKKKCESKSNNIITINNNGDSNEVHKEKHINKQNKEFINEKGNDENLNECNKNDIHGIKTGISCSLDKCNNLIENESHESVNKRLSICKNDKKKKKMKIKSTNSEKINMEKELINKNEININKSVNEEKNSQNNEILEKEKKKQRVDKTKSLIISSEEDLDQIEKKDIIPIKSDIKDENILFVNIILNIYINLFNLKNKKKFLFYYDNENRYKEFLLNNVEIIINQIKAMINKVKNNLCLSLIYFLKLIFLIFSFLNKLAKNNFKSIYTNESNVNKESDEAFMKNIKNECSSNFKYFHNPFLNSNNYKFPIINKKKEEYAEENKIKIENSNTLNSLNNNENVLNNYDFVFNNNNVFFNNVNTTSNNNITFDNNINNNDHFFNNINNNIFNYNINNNENVFNNNIDNSYFYINNHYRNNSNYINKSIQSTNLFNSSDYIFNNNNSFYYNNSVNNYINGYNCNYNNSFYINKNKCENNTWNYKNNSIINDNNINNKKKSIHEMVIDILTGIYNKNFLEILDILLKCVENNFKDEYIIVIKKIFSCMLKSLEYINEINKYKIYMFILAKIDRFIKNKRYEHNNSTLNNYNCYLLLNLVFNLFKNNKRKKNLWHILFEIHANKIKRKMNMKNNNLKNDLNNKLNNEYFKNKNNDFSNKMVISNLIKNNDRIQSENREDVKKSYLREKENNIKISDTNNFLLNNIINFLLECFINKGCIIRFFSLRIFYMMTKLFLLFIKNKIFEYEEEILKNYIIKSIYQNFFLCVFNALKEPDTNIYIYVKFRNLCLNLLYLCTKILSTNFLNEFYEKIIYNNLLYVDFFYKNKECYLNEKSEYDKTLKHIYVLFIKNSKDLYLFSSMLLFKKCKNITNFKIFKNIFKISSDEINIILNNLITKNKECLNSTENNNYYLIDLSESNNLKKRKENNKIENFSFKNININDFFSKDSQIKLMLNNKNEEELKEEVYKNFFFINIFYFLELKGLNCYNNTYIYYIFNCIFCFLNIYINRFLFFSSFIKNEHNNLNNIFYLDTYNNKEEKNNLTHIKNVKDFITELLSFLRNYFIIITLIEEHLININVELLLKKKTKKKELLNLKNFKKLIILELQKFYYTFVKLLKILYLLNRENKYNTTPFEFFFFKMIHSLDNQLIDIYTKRYIFKFLKYFTFNEKFKDILVNKIGDFYSKLKNRKKKISDSFSKKYNKKYECQNKRNDNYDCESLLIKNEDTNFNDSIYVKDEITSSLIIENDKKNDNRKKKNKNNHKNENTISKKDSNTLFTEKNYSLKENENNNNTNFTEIDKCLEEKNEQICVKNNENYINTIKKKCNEGRDKYSDNSDLKNIKKINVNKKNINNEKENKICPLYSDIDDIDKKKIEIKVTDCNRVSEDLLNIKKESNDNTEIVTETIKYSSKGINKKERKFNASVENKHKKETKNKKEDNDKAIGEEKKDINEIVQKKIDLNEINEKKELVEKVVDINKNIKLRKIKEKNISDNINEKTSFKISLNYHKIINELDKLNFNKKHNINNYKECKLKKSFYKGVELFLLSIFVFEKNKNLNDIDIFVENYDKINELIDFCKMFNIEKGLEKIVKYLFYYLREVRKKNIPNMIKLIINSFLYISLYKNSEIPFFFISFCSIFINSKNTYINKIIIHNFLIICSTYVEILKKKNSNIKNNILLQYDNNENDNYLNKITEDEFKEVTTSTVEETVNNNLLEDIKSKKNFMIDSEKDDVDNYRSKSDNQNNQKKNKKYFNKSSKKKELNNNILINDDLKKNKNDKKLKNINNNENNQNHNINEQKFLNPLNIYSNEYSKLEESVFHNKSNEKDLEDNLFLHLINFYINFICSFYFYYLTFYENNFIILKNIIFMGINKALQKKTNKKLSCFILSLFYILICLLLKVKTKEEFILTLNHEKMHKKEDRKKKMHKNSYQLNMNNIKKKYKVKIKDIKIFLVKYLISLIDENKYKNIDFINKKKFHKNIKKILNIKSYEDLEDYNYYPSRYYKNKMDKNIDKVFLIRKKKKIMIASSFNVKKNLKKVNYFPNNFSSKFIYTLLSASLLFDKENELLINDQFKKDIKDKNFTKYNLLDYIIYCCFYILFCKIKLIKIMKVFYKMDEKYIKKNFEVLKMNSYIYNKKKYSLLQFHLCIEILNLIFSNIKFLPFNSIKLIFDIFLNKAFLSLIVDKKDKNINNFQNLFYNFFFVTFYSQTQKFVLLPHFIYQYQRTLHLLHLLSNVSICEKKKFFNNSFVLEIIKNCFPHTDSMDLNNSYENRNSDEKKLAETSQRMLRSKKKFLN